MIAGAISRDPLSTSSNEEDVEVHKYLTAIFLVTAGTVSAQQMSMSDKLALRDNCKQDVQKLCPDAKPGGGELLACIKENRSQLSEACSATITDLMAKREN